MAHIHVQKHLIEKHEALCSLDKDFKSIIINKRTKETVSWELKKKYKKNVSWNTSVETKIIFKSQIENSGSETQAHRTKLKYSLEAQ